MARDPRIDALRDKMLVSENKTFTEEYFAADKRYIGNAMQVHFKDGSSTDRIQVDYPIGHRKRREEGIPVLVKKFEKSIAGKLSDSQVESLNELFADQARLERFPVTEFMSLLVR